MIFASINPILLFLYFIFVIGVMMFSQNPILRLIVFFCGAMYYICISKKESRKRDALFFASLFLLFTLTNPLFSPGGETVLFSIFHLEITLESLLYGINSSVMLIGVVIWCRIFDCVFGADNFLLLFKNFVPKLSLTLSCTLSFLPRIRKRLSDTQNAQMVMGYTTQKGLLKNVKNRLKILTAVLSSSLESAMGTADSMKARGFECAKKTSFKHLRFGALDAGFLMIFFLLFGFCIFYLAKNGLSFEFYPTLTVLSFSYVDILFYVAIFALSFLPCALFFKEEMRWKLWR